jgi:ribose 1,5-bisphosphate isomerase
MRGEWQTRIREIGDDSTSGATALLTRAVALLREAAVEPQATLEALAGDLCRAQPSMAGLRTAFHLVRTSPDPAADLDRLMQRIARAPQLIARHASELLLLRRHGSDLRTLPMRLVTCSASSAVEATIRSLASRASITVSCAEARPRLEGRAMAIRLADGGVSIELHTDAGISRAVPGADALIVGADAIGPSSFINKVGTAALCALAGSTGVPVYVLAGREKILDASEFNSLSLKEADAAEVWAGTHPGVLVCNSYFEAIPRELVSTMVTDAGPMHQI